ncbi:MAG TPA: TPM domain-containing protein [Reyranella sp.]|nr:TPM domain-containing protein [Reyranella sp.]
MAAVVMTATEWLLQCAVVRFIALVAVLCAITSTAFAFTAPERTGWVTDEAGILDDSTAAGIAAMLGDLHSKTGDEVVVVTLKSLQGASIETWGNVLGESWGIGRSAGQDTGALLIVAPNDRKVRIAVGYGLGNRISDAIADSIIADHILPYFRQGDFVQGVRSGVSSIILQLDRPRGTTAAPSSTDVERGAYPVVVHRPTFWQWLRWKLNLGHDTKMIIFWVVLFVVVFIWMVLNVGNVGGRRRRRSEDGHYYYDDDDDDGWSFSIGGSSGSSSSSSSGSSSGGSFGGGASGSW